MKFKLAVFLFIGTFCLITLNTCSDTIFSSGNNNIINGIEFTFADEEFSVTNIANQPLYYFSVERSALPAIFWLPISTDENRINPGQNVTFSYDEVLCCSQDGEISFFYWYKIYTIDDRHSDYENIQQVVIDPQTKKARKL